MKNDFYGNTNDNVQVVINGVLTTISRKELKKRMQEAKLAKMSKTAITRQERSKRLAKKIAKENQPAIKVLASDIKAMLKCCKLIKSLVAYREHGYKQWGVIVYKILNDRHISPHITTINLKYAEMQKIVDTIADLSRKGEKAIYQYVLKLSYILDDITNALEALKNAVQISGVCGLYKNHECIYGEGRRLGLRILMVRSRKALIEQGALVRRLQGIADNGVDAMSYNENDKWGF